MSWLSRFFKSFQLYLLCIRLRLPDNLKIVSFSNLRVKRGDHRIISKPSMQHRTNHNIYNSPSQFCLLVGMIRTIPRSRLPSCKDKMKRLLARYKIIQLFEICVSAQFMVWLEILANVMCDWHTFLSISGIFPEHQMFICHTLTWRTFVNIVTINRSTVVCWKQFKQYGGGWKHTSPSSGACLGCLVS